MFVSNTLGESDQVHLLGRGAGISCGRKPCELNCLPNYMTQLKGEDYWLTQRFSGHRNKDKGYASGSQSHQ